MAKRKHGLEMTTEQFREFGRCTPADFEAASDITRQLVEAETRRMAARSAASGAFPPPQLTGGESLRTVAST